MKIILLLLLLLAFFAGLYVYSTQKLDIQVTVTHPTVVQTPSPAVIKSIKENLQNASERSAKCPNVLVKSGEVLLLYNNTDTHDEMPIIFKSLDEYVNHVRIQRENGIRCPVLFLDQETTIQGEDVFRIKSTPFNDYYETFSDLVGTTIPATSGNLLFPPSNVTAFPTNVSSSTSSFSFFNMSPQLPSVTVTPYTSNATAASATSSSFNIEAFDGGMGSPTAFSSPVLAPASTPVSMPAPVSSPVPIQKPIENQQPTSSQQSATNDIAKPFDPYGQTIGKYTDLDKIHDSTAAPPLSDNPMDPNWGGTQYTKDAVESGKYIGSTVQSVNYSMPGGVQFYPGLHKTYPDPPNYTDKKLDVPTPPFLQ